MQSEDCRVQNADPAEWREGIQNGTEAVNLHEDFWQPGL
jgi:hypothetical protein